MRYVLLIFCFFASFLSATECPQHYANSGVPSVLVDTELCFSEFAVGYSNAKRSAVYAAEHITKTELPAADRLVRKDAFHEEARLVASARSLMSDYKDSGFDPFPALPDSIKGDTTQQAMVNK